MKKILFVTNMEQTAALLQDALEKVQKQYPETVSGQVCYLQSDASWENVWEKTFTEHEVIIFPWMGTGLNTKFLSESSAFLQQRQIKHLYLMSGNPEDVLHAAFTDHEIQVIKQYYVYGGLQNWFNLWLWLSQDQENEKNLAEPPINLPWDGIYHPAADKIYTDFKEYKKDFFQEGQPTIAVVFYRNDWLWNNTVFADAIIKEIETQHCNPLCFFSTSAPDSDSGCEGFRGAMYRYLIQDDKDVADVFINTIKFSLFTIRACALDDLEKMNVSVLQAYTLYRTSQEWYENFDGMSAMEISYSVSLPEFDGIIHGTPVTTNERDENGSQLTQVIPERINMLIRKAKKLAVLKRKSNYEKKIAIVFHNNPPTNSNIGSACAIDSIESIRLFLQDLKNQGYKVDRLPADRQEFINELIEHATNDRSFMNDKLIKNSDGKMTFEEYQDFYQILPEKVQKKLEIDWGKAPGEVFKYDDFLLIPGTLNGNIFITVQPPRGFGEDPDKIYHSPDCAPTHHYLAFYNWLRDIWGADAMVHVGTHGSLEWLPGKAAALSNECYPDICTGDLPNIYPYWIVDIGEGIQAKRRSAACLISYLSAPLSLAGVYGELAELEKALEEYGHFKQDKDADLTEVIRQIREKAADADLNDEVQETEFDDFDGYVGRLHTYLTDLKNMQMTTGLHILGNPPSGEKLIEYLFALTKLENGSIPSLPKVLASAYGYDYYELMDNSSKLLPDGSKSYGVLLDKVNDECLTLIRTLAEGDFVLQEKQITDLDFVKNLSDQYRQDLLLVAGYICDRLYPNLQLTTLERSNFRRALAAEYIEPSAAGAPTSGGGDILPTGRNFYGIDPQLLPTPVAWKLGSQMAEDVINKFISEEGRYPESVGILLWATYNMRSHGQCMAEFMALMGVRPVWQKGSLKVIDIEVIPLQELQRPRVDITGRISSLFRDTLPGAVCWLDKAVKMVAELDESFEDNFVRKHVIEESQRLESEGVDAASAWKQASYRLFGDPPGAHGAGVSALLAARNWENIDDIAQVYVRWGGHVYGEGEKGAYRPDLFTQRMSKLEITLSNIDNRESNLLNSDDYNSYRGGMIAAVRSIKGEMPKNYCSDSSDRQHVVIRTLDEEVKRLFRGEAINPKYINGMKEFVYKGAGDLATYVDHCFQWDATSDVMEDWMYEKFAEKYALDKDMQDWFNQVNPWALQRIAAVLLEAEQRNLWDAKPETKAELQKLYLSMEGELEELSDKISE